jgi:competence protein ComEA
MPSISRPRALAYAALVLVLLVAGGRFLTSGPDAAPGDDPAAAGMEVIEAEPADAPEVVVHVAGAVRQPGLYTLEEGSRIDAAIARAGGPTGTAVLDAVNLAAPVADGQQILVPARGDDGRASPTGSPGAPGVPGAGGGQVRLNTATLEQLDTLPGIGPVTAQKILDYRDEKGAFQSVDELDAVPGIGPARLEQLRELVDL